MGNSPVFFQSPPSVPHLGLNEVDPSYDISGLQGGKISDGLNVFYEPKTASFIFEVNDTEYGTFKYKVDLISFLTMTGVADNTTVLSDRTALSNYTLKQIDGSDDGIEQKRSNAMPPISIEPYFFHVTKCKQLAGERGKATEFVPPE